MNHFKTTSFVVLAASLLSAPMIAAHPYSILGDKTTLETENARLNLGKKNSILDDKTLLNAASAPLTSGQKTGITQPSTYDHLNREMKKATGVFMGIAAGMTVMQQVQSNRGDQFTETDILMPVGSAGIAQLTASYALGDISLSELPKYGTTFMGMVVGGALGQAAATCLQANDDSRDTFLKYGTALGGAAGYLTGSALVGTARAAKSWVSSWWGSSEEEPTIETAAEETIAPNASTTPNLTGVEKIGPVEASTPVQFVALDGTFELQHFLKQQNLSYILTKELKVTSAQSTLIVKNEDQEKHATINNEMLLAADLACKELKKTFEIL